MENEIKILCNIDSSRRVTQRDISRITGISLGNVNILIKRLVKKGLIKVEKIDKKTIQYLLTPRGIREKAQVLYNYIVNSYKCVNDLDAAIYKILVDQMNKGRDFAVLFGVTDEISQLFIKRISQLGLHYIVITNVIALEDFIAKPYGAENTSIAGSRIFVAVWQPDYMECLKDNELNISILNPLGYL